MRMLTMVLSLLPNALPVSMNNRQSTYTAFPLFFNTRLQKRSKTPAYQLKNPLLLGALGLILVGCDSTPTYDYIEGETMGTSYHIRYRQPTNVNQIDIKNAINERLVEINDSMSTYQNDSTISVFNRLPASQPLKVDDDFVAVMADAKEVYVGSGGAFDPTVMPLIDVWGFGSTTTVDRLQNPPTQADINKARALIDFDSILMEGNMLSKAKDGVEIDFSAIAKGYGVDVITDVLQNKYQINDYMVEIGGEVATKGVNPISQAWQIAIDAPVNDSSVTSRKPLTVIRQPASTMALHIATSGNYRNSVVFDGKRYSHTIDPINGQPVAGGAPSVTVAADTVSLADAWATALTAMPYEQALQTATDNALPALFIIPADGDLSNTVVDTISSQDSGDFVNMQWQVVETAQMQTLRSDRRTSESP